MAGRSGESLVDFLESTVYPRLFERLDEAFPEFGWRRTRDGWVATDRETTKRVLDARPDRVVCNQPYGFMAHGGASIAWTTYVNDGAQARGPDFVRAVRALCERAGVTLPEREVSPEEARARQEAEARRRLIGPFLQALAKLYHEPGAAEARTYMASRGFDDDVARALGFGYFPCAAAVRQALPAELHEPARRAELLRDRHEGYVFVPWNDAAGRPVTAVGRWHGQEPPDGRPKALSLPGVGSHASPLYLDRALAAKHTDLVLVEGLLDAALLQAKGDTRVVASGSAQLSRAQVETLVRQRLRSVTICLDPDDAGTKGALACVKALEAAGITAYVTPKLPDGLDPDELVLRDGIGAWRAHVGRAVSGAEHRVARLLAGVTPESPAPERDRVVAEVKALLADLPAERSALERDKVLPRVAAATGHRRAALERALGQGKRRETTNRRESAATSDGSYREGPDGIVWLRQRTGQNGRVETEEVRLCNFTAQISAEVVEDDGAEQRRFFEIDGAVGEDRRTFRVAAGEFSELAWVVQELGASAILETGAGVRDRVRHAVQTLSGRPPVRKVFAHLGWTEVDGARVYLHAGGAIGAEGPVEGVHVRLDEPLDRFVLPTPVGGQALVAAIEATVRVLDVAPRRITAVGLAAVFRAALGPCDFAVYLFGTTGSGKSSLAGVLQQHWGPRLDHQNLPGSWESTGNALEGLLFLAKDTLFFVDDFVPTGSAQDRARKQKDADRVFRGQGNRAGRARMKSDATLRPIRRSRALLASTGEDLPRGESLNARFVPVEVGPGDVDFEQLTRVQEDGASGLLSETLAGYVQWLARHPDLTRALARGVAALRAEFRGLGGHARAAEIAANLLLGLRAFARFAEAAGAFTAERARAFLHEGRAAITDALTRQRASQAEENPIEQFFGYLRTGIDLGRAHVADPSGRVPTGNPLGWGWRLEGEGRPTREAWHPESQPSEPTWRAQGERVGYLVGEDDLYLDLQACLAVVERVAGVDGFPLSRRALARRLRESGRIRTLNPSRETICTRIVIGGVSRNLVHLGADALGEGVEDDLTVSKGGVS